MYALKITPYDAEIIAIVIDVSIGGKTRRRKKNAIEQNVAVIVAAVFAALAAAVVVVVGGVVLAVVALRLNRSGYPRTCSNTQSPHCCLTDSPSYTSYTYTPQIYTSCYIWTGKTRSGHETRHDVYVTYNQQEQWNV